MSKSESARSTFRNIPLRVPADLVSQIDDACRATKLSKQDVMRLSLERGLSVLVAQLKANPA